MARLNLHLVSDSTGETLEMIAKAALAQFDDPSVNRHFWPMVRSRQHLDRIVPDLADNPGLVLFTLVNPETRARLEEHCRHLGLPAVPVLDQLINWVRGEAFDGDLSGETKPFEEFVNVHEGTRDRVTCLQLRGEYLFTAEGRGGFRAYDVASIGNKGVSERIITAPFSPLGHDTHVETENATCMAVATTQPIAPERNTAKMREVNQEQPFSPVYDYAFVTDSVEGLIDH